MDTSETYIKMCEKAVEIRKDYPNRSNDDGSFVLYKKGVVGIVFYQHKWYHGNCSYPYISYEEAHEARVGKWDDKLIWLPRQDQLQEMVGPKWVRHLINDFFYFCSPMEAGEDNAASMELYISQFKSIEQLWLAFVMKGKYGKVWNGEGWVV